MKPSIKSPLESFIAGSGLEASTNKRDWKKETLIEWTMNIPPIKPTIFFRESWACTEDGILVVSGQKKAGKSIMLTKLIETAITPREKVDLEKTLFIRAEQIKKEKKIVYIDTEQARPRTKDFIGRIFKSAGYEKQPDNLIFYNVKRLLVSERIQFLKEEIVPQAKDLGLIIFDGIVDFVKSMNDEAEAKDLIELIFSNIPETVSIVMVIHSGKGTSDAMGHIGQMLEKKCAGTIHVSKDRDKGVHTIKSKLIRDTDDFEDIHFKWDAATHGFRVLSELDMKAVAAKTEEDRIEEMKTLVTQIFAVNAHLTKKQVYERIDNHDKTINRNTKEASQRKAIKRKFDDLLQFDLIIQEPDKDEFSKNF